MNTMLLSSVVLLFGGIGLVVLCVWWYKRLDFISDWQLLAGAGVIIGGLAILFGIFIPATTYGGRAYGRVECRNWGQQTNRPTKFVVYTSWDGGNCLTRDDHGKWISKDLVRQFGTGR